MLLITGADEYIGYCIVSYLAQFEKLRTQIRVTCQNMKRCFGFKQAGIDVREVDYSDPNQLSQALRGIDQVLLIIGNEKNRLKNAKYICQIAVQSSVTSIICISHVGAASKTHPSLQEFYQIEQEVMNYAPQYTIIRLDFIQQYFHLWSNYVEKHRQMILPLPESTEMCPIDITDICKVIELLCLDMKNQEFKPLDDDHDGQVYILTGPESLTGKDITQCLIEATNYQHFKYIKVRSMDLNYYLSGLKRDIWFDARIKHEMTQIYHSKYNGDYSSKAYCNPSDKQIQTYLEYFDWIQQTSNSLCAPHLNMLIQSKGKSIQEFFKENANSFKPRV